MDFLHQIKHAFSFYWKAVRFIDQHNLWRILVTPAILSLTLALLMILLALKTSGFVVEFFLSTFRPVSGDSSFYSFLENLMLVILRFSVIFLYLKIYRYLILILFAPIFAFVSGKVHTIDHLKRKSEATSMKYLYDCTRGMRIALKNFFIELALTVAIIIASLLITWLIPVAPLAILLIESYFFGFSMMDYRNEFLDMSVKESKELSGKYLGLVVGNGLFFNFFLLIPLIGILFAPMLALVASGLSVNYLEKRKSLLCPSDQSTLIVARS